MTIQNLDKPQKYVGLSTDDKTNYEQEGNIIYYSDTKVWKIYHNSAWDDYTELNDLQTLIGEVQANPTANTVLGRLKDVLTGIVLAAGNAIIGKVGIDQTTDGTTNRVVAKISQTAGENVVVASLDGSLQKESYIIPMFDLLAWSGFTNQPANDGVEIISDSASDVGLCTIFGTTNATGAFAYETVTLTGASAKATTKTDWGNIYGVFLGDIYGQNITPAVGTITIREASADQTITTIVATKISKGMVAFDLTEKSIILNVHSGNVWKRCAGVVTTSNGFKLNLTGGNIKEERIATYLYLISDTTGATAQIEVLTS